MRKAIVMMLLAAVNSGAAAEWIEANETYVGGKERTKHASKRDKKNISGKRLTYRRINAAT